MDRVEFEKLVNEAISNMPEKIQKLLENVEIVIDDWPTQNQLQKVGLSNKCSLLGLYEGIPKTKRGAHYANVLPDKITIFQKVIERIAKDEDNIKRIVEKTVWHEIAHHFGFDEKRVRELEKKKFQ